jgi:hypothetical protein
MSKRGQTGLALAGLALVVGFFLPWIDVGGVFTVSGFAMVWRGEGGGIGRFLLAMVPLVGVALACAGVLGSRKAAGIALAAGGGIFGYFLWTLARGFIATTGIGLWLVLGASVAALVFGLTAKKPA